MFAFGVGLCLLAFLSTFLAGRRTLAMGLAATFFWGYFFGILRANILSPASHFIFDCSLAGCYSSLLFQRVDGSVKLRSGGLRDWFSVIAAWTGLIALLPFQTPLVTMVGLRGNLFFVPVLLLACRLKDASLRWLMTAIAFLNIIASGFGLAEYFLGIERFYPYTAVTSIIYLSHDAGSHYRIPGIFSNAHSYAGAMVGTMPLLLTTIGLPHASGVQRVVCLLGVIASLAGVLFANTRLNFVMALFLLTAFFLIGKMRPVLKALLMLIVVVVALVALSNDRFQRFRSLKDADLVSNRIAGSVNRSFIEVLTEYPMGNGLGGGGTSVPYFLENQVRRAISVENEYARISLELGIPGLIIWICFLLWILMRGFHFDPNDPWRQGRQLIWCYLAFGFVMSLLGTGLLTAIPGTVNMLLLSGWLITRPAPEDLELGGNSSSQRITSSRNGISTQH